MTTTARTLPDVLTRGLRVPVVAAPMFLISNPELVVAQCRAGVLGSFPALNARPTSQLDEWLHEVEEALGPDDPAFAVNQIVHRSNQRLEDDMQVLVDHEVPIVITSLGAREDVYEAVHSYGGIVLHDVINDMFARKAVDKGADGLVAVAAGAGGHAGTTSPFALVQDVRRWFDGPVLLSGSIATGGAVLAARAMGADLAYVGSAFIATQEAHAQPEYKQMVVDSAAEDVVYTDHFSGVKANYLRGSIERMGLDPDDLPEEGGGSLDALSDEGAGEVKAWRDIWGAGQGVGAVDAVVPTAELVDRLVREHDAALARLGG